MLLYAGLGGFAAIYLLLAALYWNAWRQRSELALNVVERILTKGFLIDHAAQAAVGGLACVVALLLPPSKAGLSGYVYFLIGVTKTVVGSRVGAKARAARVAMAGEDGHAGAVAG